MKKRFRVLILYLFPPLIFFLPGLHAGGIDSLLKALSTQTKEDTNRAMTLNSLCWAHMFKGDYPTSLSYADSTLRLSKKLNYLKGISWALNARGNVYKNQGDYVQALRDMNAALKIRESLKNQRDIAVSASNIGVVYKLIGKFPEAQQYYLKALHIYEEQKDSFGIAIALNNIGEIYRSQNNLSEALNYYMRSKKIREGIKDESGMASCNMNIGAVHFMKKDFPSALQNFERSLELGRKTNRSGIVATANMNIGAVYDELFKLARKSGDEGSAKEYIKKALENYLAAEELFKKSGDKNGLADVQIKIGVYYSELGEYKKSSAYLQNTLPVVIQMQNKRTLADCYLALSELADVTRDFQNAHRYYKLYIATRDSLVNEENMRKTVEQQMQYDFDKQQAVQKAEREKEELKNAQEKRKQQIVFWFTLGGLIVVLVLAAVIFRSLVLNKRKNKIILEQKMLVEKQKHLVESKQKEILDSIHYAKRIQASLLASEVYINRVLNESKRNKKK